MEEETKDLGIRFLLQMLYVNPQEVGGGGGAKWLTGF